jgi:ParB family chromosome partitioning protein
MLKTALEFLPIDSITTNPARPRQSISQQSLLQLADSIRKYGIIAPLLVNKRGTTYHIICGERRYRAAKIAGLEDIPCVIVTVDPKELALLSLAENLQRENLNLVDQAFLVSKLHGDLGFTLIEIGESTGLPLKDLENLLLVLELPERIRRGYLEKKISEKDLLELITIEEPIEQETRFKELMKRTT